jgi:uncharacterized membrane protein
MISSNIAEESVSDEALQTSPHNGNPGMSRVERILSALGGSAFVVGGLRHGLTRGTLIGGGLAAGLCGGVLIYRGLTGQKIGSRIREIAGANLTTRAGVPSGAGVRISRSLTIQRPAHELYARWRDLTNLPKIMRHLEDVEIIDAKRSRWTAEGVLGRSVQWEAEIIGDKQPEEISWQSLPGGDLQTAGSVRFKPLRHGRGTELKVTLKYNPPAGRLGASVAKLLGQGLVQKLDEDLRRFRSVLEAGEAPTISGQPHGDGPRGRLLPFTSES